MTSFPDALIAQRYRAHIAVLCKKIMLFFLCFMGGALHGGRCLLFKFNFVNTGPIMSRQFGYSDSVKTFIGIEAMLGVL